MSRQQRIRTIGSGRYEVSDEVLGEGSFGKVHSGRNVFMKEDVAVKVVHKNGLSRYMRQRLAAELQIHTKIQHTNIVKMHDVVDEGDVIYLIFEHLSGGDMFDYVINNGRLDEAEARRLFMQLCQALDHCHSNSIIHHDVKLENCMLKKSESGISLKLVDFGLSCLCVAGQKLQTFSGTEAYCAAEILAGRPYDGKLIDAYSAGVLLYICLTGAYPFSQDLEAQHREQNDSRYLAALPFPECVSKEAQDLVLQLIQPTPEKRLTIQDALKHPFLSAQQTDTRVESPEVFMQMQEEEDDEFAFEATSGIDEEEEEDEEMPLECSAWEEEEWNMLSEEFGEAGSWEDRMTPDCKPL